MPPPTPPEPPHTAPAVRRVVPGPAAEIAIAEAYVADRPRVGDRPWIGLCMVASLDGSVTVEGVSGALGNDNDLAVLTTLRRLADLIVVGAGTVRDEGYGPPRKAGQRIGVVTNRGAVDVDSELFTSGAGFLIAPESADIDETRVEVLRAGTDRVDLATAIGRLDEVDPDVAYVQAEGGPHLNASLVAADLLDEVDLTISPRLVGGTGPRLTQSDEEVVRALELRQLLVDDEGYLFGRWVRADAPA